MPEPTIDVANADLLLTTTRAVRKRLDLERPVPREVILECIRLAVQAPTASNSQTWRFIVVTDPDKRAALADLYGATGRPYLEAGARGFLLKSDADDYVIAAVQALSQHKPFFTGKVSETLIASFLAASGAKRPSALTMRENAVVQLIAEGRTCKEGADLLGVSAKTVEAARASALRKLNLKTTADLIRYAVRNKLVDG